MNASTYIDSILSLWQYTVVMPKTKKSPIHTHTPAGAAFTELLLETFKLNGFLLLAGDRLVHHLNLTSARWQVVGAIDLAHIPLTVAQIARNMGLQRQSVQRLVNVLDAEGLIQLIENPHHKRAKLVQLTERGQATLKQVQHVQVEWANHVSLGMRERAVKEAVGVLREFSKRLKGR